MSHYDVNELISLWEREGLTVEQAIGQILLVLIALHKRLLKLEATPSQRS